MQHKKWLNMTNNHCRPARLALAPPRARAQASYPPRDRLVNRKVGECRGYPKNGYVYWGKWSTLSFLGVLSSVKLNSFQGLAFHQAPKWALWYLVNPWVSNWKDLSKVPKEVISFGTEMTPPPISYSQGGCPSGVDNTTTTNNNGVVWAT